MIIERQYELLGRLIERDPDAEKIYRKACYYKADKELGDLIYEANKRGRVCDLEMGSGIVDPTILFDGFAELDKLKPYDNGFSLNDVNRAYIIDGSTNTDCGDESEKPAWIKVALVQEINGFRNYIKTIDVTE